MHARNLKPLLLSIHHTPSGALCEDKVGITPLHRVVSSQTVDAIETILCMLAESQGTQAMDSQDGNGRTQLHYAITRNFESLHRILTVLPEAERLRAMIKPDAPGMTVLHHVAHRDDVEAILDFPATGIIVCWT